MAIAAPTAVPASAILPVMVRHVVERDWAADLFGQSGAARVVAQHPARVVERGQHLVPTVQRAVHLVHQNQRRLAAAGKFVAQACAVHLDPVHGVPSLA
jgi:hypothetical protein